ncbi:MAG: substrate-binding domain-containing protein [Succinivibrionaceae bacterium]|nr:substrate-binding domain-containing protein [Succinivibrionaceae bacterium]
MKIAKILLAALLLAALTPLAQAALQGPPRVVLLMRNLDPFNQILAQAMEDEAEQRGFDIRSVSASDNRELQLQQLRDALMDGLDAIIINVVDRDSAEEMVDRILSRYEEVPIIFIDRDVPEGVTFKSKSIWYVGASNPDAGTMMAESVLDRFSVGMDRGGDTVLSYLGVHGPEGDMHQIQRSKAFHAAMGVTWIESKCLGEVYLDWSRRAADDFMSRYLSTHDVTTLDVVACDNDDMALGVLDALQRNGYNSGYDDANARYFVHSGSSHIGVVSIDGTAAAIEAVGKHRLDATILNDTMRQAAITCNLIEAIFDGADIGIDVTMEKEIWPRSVLVPHVKITDLNVKRFADYYTLY